MMIRVEQLGQLFSKWSSCLFNIGLRNYSNRLKAIEFRPGGGAAFSVQNTSYLSVEESVVVVSGSASLI